MAKNVLVLIGTRKGAFILESDSKRKSWGLKGPFCATWPMNHLVGNPTTGTIYGGGGNEWFGPAVWKSTDLGESWTHSSKGLAYERGAEPITAVWSVAPNNGILYAGVQPAGLFRSDDRGETWQHVEGLRKHPSRPQWSPGNAGLILHSMVLHPNDENQMWIGISAAGVFYTSDRGKTWEARNKGTRADFLPEGENYPEFGQCVHNFVMAAGKPDRLYQQNHCGMYRSDDGGKSWQSIEQGLPSSFGFPVAAHSSNPDTVFMIPLNGDTAGRYMPDAKAAVWRTRDAGKTWQDLREGLPQQNAYFGVLRQAMATDRLEPGGVYFGTSSGTVFASANEGDSFAPIAEHLPVITSVETMVVEG
ncbi:WD40/YVTN/BNR-like repeat-containing protein [Mesorhizobium silamurunense]|uniref:WD40/YVTN/BNR-like repeat-containing protein n=1 Tax=Mesorhizobium silamurunense TaxID=499528 RepID=UPI0017861149|nr:exo-alpha-sialidase [Mesorhizobium silamurunense]